MIEPEAEIDEALQVFKGEMTQDTTSSYTVAATTEMGWCPCCGIIVRLYDDDGKYFAKLIMDDDTAKAFRSDLLRRIQQRKWLMPTPEDKVDLEQRLEHAIQTSDIQGKP